MPAGDRSKLAAWAALILAALMTPALAQKQYGPGVTDTEIKIGTTTPYSGPASAYAAGAISATAYFAMINDQGGVNGRKINYISLDDAYSPPKTVEQIRRLIESDEVLFLVNPVGTADQHGGGQIHQPEKSAASVHRHRRHRVQRSRALSVDHELDAALRIRRRDLRQIYSCDQARRQNRHPVAERRPRPRLHARLQARARRQGREHDRLAADLQHQRPDRGFPGGVAEGFGRRCVPDLLGAEIRGPGHSQGL